MRLLVLILIVGLLLGGFGGYRGYYGTAWSGPYLGGGIGLIVLILIVLLLVGY